MANSDYDLDVDELIDTLRAIGFTAMKIECGNCIDGAYARCPRCHAESGLSCPHGDLCDECQNEVKDEG